MSPVMNRVNLFLKSAAFILIATLTGRATEHPGLFKLYPAPATRPEIQVSIGRLAEGQHWAVLLEPKGDLAGFAVAPGFVIPMDLTRPGQRSPDAIGVLPATLYTLGDSSLQTGDMSDTAKSVFVVSQVPIGRTVNITFNSTLVYRATVSSTTLLVDGNIAPDATAARALMTQLLSVPPLIDDLFGADMKQNSGEWTATTAGLRRHLEILPDIQSPLIGQTFPLADGRAAYATARIQIDATGKVARVLMEAGTGPLADGARLALSKAHFTPFTHDGLAVAVEGRVTYSLSNDGAPPIVSIAGK